MHLGTHPGIIGNLLKDKYKAWRLKILKEIFLIAEDTVGGVVGVAAMCKQGKHRSTATAWYVEHAMMAVGFRVGYQHLSWLEQDTVFCQRSKKICEECSRSNPELEPLKRRVEAESSTIQDQVKHN